jgi:acetylornithine aminotransferase
MNIESIDRDFVLHSYGREYVNFVKGEGAKLYSDDNKEYIDFASGIGVCSVGHGNKELTNAICEQASNLLHVSNLWVIEPQALLAKRVVELSGYDMRVFFANSGAEANEGALKIARKYGQTNFDKKRYKIITLEHSFHGRTITTVKATGQEKMHTPNFSPYPDGFKHVSTIEDVYKSIDEQTVAVMIELVQGEGGVEPFDKEQIKELAKSLKEKGLLLIVDEVQTGVYRSGEFLASNYYEIEPDIITLAKGLGGGLPIGAVMTNLKDIFEPGDHGSTFGGNYLSTRGALCVVDILEKEYANKEIKKRVELFDKELREVAKQYPNLFDKSVGLGLMRGLRAKSSDIQTQVVKKAFESGLILLKAGRDTVRFLPPLTITNSEIAEGFKRLKSILKEIEA